MSSAEGDWPWNNLFKTTMSLTFTLSLTWILTHTLTIILTLTSTSTSTLIGTSTSILTLILTEISAQGCQGWGVWPTSCSRYEGTCLGRWTGSNSSKVKCRKRTLHVHVNQILTLNLEFWVVKPRWADQCTFEHDSVRTMLDGTRVRQKHLICHKQNQLSFSNYHGADQWSLHLNVDLPHKWIFTTRLVKTSTNRSVLQRQTKTDSTLLLMPQFRWTILIVTEYKSLDWW